MSLESRKARINAGKGYWMRPSLARSKPDNGGCLTLGPVQFNWYGEGWRVYLTWPGRTRTLVAR